MISAMTFSDVTKQNGHVSVATLYKDVLGETVFSYDSVRAYQFEKGKR